jgi:glycogen operon protein
MHSISEGNPNQLGAIYDGVGTNFALFSANAEKVELCLFDATGNREVERIPLPVSTHDVWHGYIEGVKPGQLYGYRVHGPYAPEEGHRFNPHKLLLDPYARLHHGRLQWHDACFGYQVGEGDLSFDSRDSAPYMPKCVVTDDTFSWSAADGGHRVPWPETVLYELHVKGFTRNHPGIAKELRGKYGGLCAPEAIRHFKELGVTSLSIQPIHNFVDDRHLLDRGLKNYWGYNTLGFFAPAARYTGPTKTPLQDVKTMVSRLHDAGIEVILDVVYNHTAEGNELGPTLSFRGIDNASYYRLPEDRRYYINDTGTGNTLNLSHPRVLQMVMDSLRYWATEMKVDGFRFDLGTILGRTDAGFEAQSNFLSACLQDPVLAQAKLIAEPWDCGPGGYQVGGFPAGWAEWNDTFRDTVRDYWRGEADAGALATRLCASADIYNNNGRKPWASVNFVTAHDGFTVRDLVSYNDRHNEANGEDNNDGHDDNRSWNCGAEGETDDADIRALRLRQMKNLLATLFLSQGTPMLQAGDEIGASRQGNNNAYCQDNEIGWVQWRDDDDAQELFRFCQMLTALRQTHPALRQANFLGDEDVAWLSPAGNAMQGQDWHSAAFGMHFTATPENEKALLIIFNGGHESADFRLPAGHRWSRLADTHLPAGEEAVPLDGGEAYNVAPRAMVILERAA